MDEKELNNIPAENTEEPEKEVENKITDSPAEKAEESVEKEAEDKDTSSWKFDAEVKTGLEDIELSYSGKEIELPKTENKKVQPENSDVISIDKRAVKKTFKIIGIVLAAILALAVVAFGVVFGFVKPNSQEIMTPANTALEVGGEKISVGYYNFCYNTITSEENLQNYSYYYGLDLTKPYDEQYYDEEKKQTWSDFFEERAIENLQYIIMYKNKAEKDGMKLTDEQKKDIDSSIESIKSYAEQAEQTFDEFVKENYGEYMGEKTIRKILENEYLAQSYQGIDRIERTFTDEQINKHLEENKEEFYTSAFRYVPFTYTEDTQEAKDEAKKKAETFLAAVNDPAKFTEISKNYVSSDIKDQITESTTLLSGVKEDSDIPSAILDFIFDDNTKVNDKKAILDEDSSCYWAVMLVRKQSLDESPVFTVRHILITPEISEDAEEATQEQWNAAQEKANSILAEYEKGEKTERAFAELAEKNSADTASITSGGAGGYGGLCETIKEGETVEPFEKWSTDPSRKYGDTEIIKSEYGYHIMFYVRGGEAWKMSVHDALVSESIKNDVKSVEVKKKAGFSKCTKLVFDEKSTETESANG